MATPTQVYNALKVHNLFNIQNANAPINFSQWDDITDWSSLGLSTSNGDVVKIIGQVVAPSGIVAYENAGFAGSSFASPDTSLTDLISPQWNLPAYTGTTTYVNGNYVFNLKAQVESNANTITGTDLIIRNPSALPNNILTHSTPTVPPASTIKFFVLGNVAVSLMNKGDIYSLTSPNGDIVTYTIPSATQTVQQFYDALYQAVIDYQTNNPLSDWTRMLPTVDSNANQYWLNLTRTNVVTCNVTITYTPFGTTQKSAAQYGTTPFGTPPTAGAVIGFTVLGETISYTVVQGDTLVSMVANLYANLQTYITLNPSSDIAQDLICSLDSNFIVFESIYANTAFTLTVNVTAPPPYIFIVEKTFSFNLPKGVTPTLTLTETWDCTVATYTSTDTSEYCTSGCASGYSVTTIVRSHTVYPPEVSGQADVTADAQTILLGAPDNQLWTGTYEAKLSNTITLTQGDCEIITHASVTTEAKVICDDLLCGLYCSLKTLYNTFKGYLGINTTEATRYQAMLTKGFFAYDMALRARLCSDEATVATYVADFYKFTGADPNCDCCKDESSPVIPTNVINGTNGTNGETPAFRVTAGTIFQYKFPSDAGWTTIFDFSSITGLNGTSFLQGAGVPSSGDGADGDSFLNIITYDIYLKTAGSWAITGNIQGASGTNGTDGVAVLVNDQSTTTTPSTTANYVLKTYTVPANTLGTNGDMLKIETTISRDVTVTSSTAVSVYKVNFGGTQVSVGSLYGYGSNSNQNTVTLNLVRKSSTEIQCDAVAVASSESGTTLAQEFGVGTVIAGFDFTVTNTVTLTTTSIVTGDTYSKLFRITKFKK